MSSGEQVAVITGAASGIGLALSQTCLELGFHVVMADKAVTALCDKVEQLSEKTKTDVLGVVCDVSKPQSLEHLAKQTFARFKRVDWLFNNAGISGHLAPLWELSNSQIHNVIDINLYGVIYSLQAFLPHMFKQLHRSHVINISSLYGLCSGSNLAPYAMSKHAIVALSESLYFDFHRLDKPVDVSVVCPSFVNTGLLTNSAALANDKFHQMVSDLISRCRSPSEIAQYIVQEVKNKTFYILPDREVKDYCEQRARAIIDQTFPHKHSMEKILATLSARAAVEI